MALENAPTAHPCLHHSLQVRQAEHAVHGSREQEVLGAPPRMEAALDASRLLLGLKKSSKQVALLG